MTVTLQGLGKLDGDLAQEDQAMLSARRGGFSDGSSVAESLELTERLTVSYLWVLGAYEVVRSLDQRIREAPSLNDRWHSKSLQLKRRFERLRVPLAKFEAARHHQDTDSHVALPALNEQHGIAWQVAQTEFISRGGLSEQLLSFLEEFRRETRP